MTPKPLLSPEQLDFLAEQNLAHEPVSFLAGDASFRTYYRVGNPPQSLVLMDAPPPENPVPFIRISKLLRSLELSAPGIVESDLEKGVLLLEDLGDETYTRILHRDHSMETMQRLYFLAIDVLIKIHQNLTRKPDFVAPYGPEIHLNEAMLLLSWYYPAIYGVPLNEDAVRTYQELWTAVLEHTYGPESLVLRDYHVDNLLILKGRSQLQQCGLLDFQDALWGSVTYDVVSLLEDARRDVPEELQKQCWDRYCKAFPDVDQHHLREYGAVLSAARHAKIIGIFTRLAVRDKKNNYLRHIPRLWRLMDHCLGQPVLASLKEWFDVHFPDRSVPHV